MSQNKIELRVGLFVLLGLLLLMTLLLLFSKGLSFSPAVTLRLHAQSAGILKVHAPVEMSGVLVGSISQIELAPDGKSVTIFLRVEKKYQVHKDARFVIEQSGFLGDQFVSILPVDNTGPLLADGDVVTAEPPFDLQEVARSAAGILKRVNDTISDVRRDVLNDQTLTNLAASVIALNQFSAKALDTVTNLNELVQTNGPQISQAVQNIQSVTATLTNLLSDVQSGKGLVGRAIEDRQLADNLAETVANLEAVSSNLNRFGLWHALWHKNPPLTNAPAAVPPGN
jgi:phospholipid/cholesterol/gamma-HCH transport system substrate-binding protein